MLSEVTTISITEKFDALQKEKAELFRRKNHDYANGGDFDGNFVRVANILSQYPGFPCDSPRGVIVTNMLKQLDALMWGECQGMEQLVEDGSVRAKDISLYADLYILRFLKDRNLTKLDSTPK